MPGAFVRMFASDWWEAKFNLSFCISQPTAGPLLVVSWNPEQISGSRAKDPGSTVCETFGWILYWGTYLAVELNQGPFSHFICRM